MSRVRDWLYLLRRTRRLPSAVSHELGTLHGLAAQVPALRERVDRLEQMVHDVGAGVARVIHTLDDVYARQVPAEELRETGARLRDGLAAAVAELHGELERARAHTDETAAALRDEAREHALILEHEIRTPARDAAEAAFRATLPASGERAEGLSVLVPCWQHAPLLGDAVASARRALDALAVPGEIIVSDDASRDASGDVARALAAADARIRLLAHPVNLGLARARNVQLAQARFRHALLLDADNTLEPAGVAALYASAVATGAVLAYGASAIVDQDGRPHGVHGGEPASPELLWANWIDTLGIVDTTALQALGGLDTGAHGLQDWELALRLVSLRRPVTFVPTVVGYYRTSALSMIADAAGRRRHRRLQRLYGIDGPLPAAELAAATHHPALGWLATSSGWTGATPLTPPPGTTPATARPRVLVVSSGGVRNHGDDVILHATLDRLARLRPGCVPVVVTDGDAPPPLGRRAVWAGTTSELCDALRGGTAVDPALPDLRAFDVVLLAGGGNLAAPWTYLVAWRTAIATAARQAGVPVIASGQGIGPLDDATVPLLQSLVSAAHAVAVRDPGSAALLAAYGLHADVAGDDGLGVIVTPRSSVDAIGFQVRRAEYVGARVEQLRGLAAAVDALAAARGVAVLGIPMNAQAPQPEAALLLALRDALPRRRAHWMLAAVDDDALAAAAAIKACRAVVTCSFHTAQLALEAGVPAALVVATEYYALKAQALRDAFGLPAPIDVGLDADAASLAARLPAPPWTPRLSSATVDAWLDAALSAAGR